MTNFLPRLKNLVIDEVVIVNHFIKRKYSTVVFIAGNRFETNKRKLQYLTFKDFYTCAHAMMTYWTSPINDEANADADVEREFLMDLRELRILLDKEKEHKTWVCMNHNLVLSFND